MFILKRSSNFLRLFCQEVFFLIHAQEWPLFLLETREENPLFGVHTKNKTTAWFALARWFFRHFLHNQVSLSYGPKHKFVAKTWKYGQPTSSLWKPTIGAKLSLWNLLTDAPNKGFSSRVSGKKSGHFCACMRTNKVCYTGGTRWFSPVSLTLLFSSLSLPFSPCSINVYFLQKLLINQVKCYFFIKNS